jgi:hypothetical protein
MPRDTGSAAGGVEAASTAMSTPQISQQVPRNYLWTRLLMHSPKCCSNARETTSATLDCTAISCTSRKRSRLMMRARYGVSAAERRGSGNELDKLAIGPRGKKSAFPQFSA